MIIQIIGIPGSGKTTLATKLSSRINATHINADYVRSTINSDLGFSIEDRVENARRLGAIAKMLSEQGQTVIVDFVCPTKKTRDAFGKPDILIWMDRIKEGRFEDTNKLWEDPIIYDESFDSTIEADDRVQYIIDKYNLPDWKAPTTLMLGRYQPWHEGHHALYFEAKKRTEQVVLGVRDTQGTSEKDPLSYEEVNGYIRQDASLNFPFVIKMPNITNIVYGRDVGYKIEQVGLDKNIEAISATQKRKELGL